MTINQQLKDRSGNLCELTNVSGDTVSLNTYCIPPYNDDALAHCIYVTQSSIDQLSGIAEINTDMWRTSLPDAIWSPIPAVQVAAYRLLKKLESEKWAADLLSQMYLDEETQVWADASSSSIVHKDSNGQVLQEGDTVTLIKDLDVKGANFTAKRGVAVRNIRLVRDNAEQIEGRVNDQSIVILTQYVKKS
jgi:protein PhnA